MQKIFDESVSLSVVYNFKNKLHDILNNKYTELEKFQETIEGWRLEAKKEGIDYLDEFSDSLKGYKII